MVSVATCGSVACTRPAACQPGFLASAFQTIESVCLTDKENALCPPLDCTNRKRQVEQQQLLLQLFAVHFSQDWLAGALGKTHSRACATLSRPQVTATLRAPAWHRVPTFRANQRCRFERAAWVALCRAPPANQARCA